ncbi:MAG: hypothetical protein V7750_18275 [Sneathiella sp.]
MVVKFKNTHFKLAVIITSLTIFTGCTSATDYADTINELKAATDSSISTISAIDKKITKNKNEIWLEDILTGKALLENKDNSCAAGLAECSLEVRRPGEKGIKYPITSVLVKSQVALAGLKSYVGNLQSIVDAKTAGKIAAQTNRTLASLVKIEAEIAKEKGKNPKPGTIATYSEPVGAFFNWAVEQYVDHIKVDALASATKQSHPIIVQLDVLIQSVSNSSALVEFAKAQKAFVTEKTKFETAQDKGNITEAIVRDFIGAANAYNQALKAKASEPLKAFTAAHEKLMKHLNSEDGTSLVDVITAIENLTQKAKEFKGLAEGFESAGT